MELPSTCAVAHKGAAGFINTHWSKVMAAGKAGTPQAEHALEWLCRAYWPPLYAFVRAQRKTPAEAEDIIQEFFYQLIKGNFLERVDPARGRFRSFLLGCLKHFMANQWHASQAQKRGGGCQFLPIDMEGGEAAYLDTPTTDTPEYVYDLEWAITIVNRATHRLRCEFVDRQKEDLFLALTPFLADSRPTAHAKLAAQLGISTEAVAVAVSRFRERYADLLREEVAETVSDPVEVEDEVRYLLKVLSSRL